MSLLHITCHLTDRTVASKFTISSNCAYITPMTRNFFLTSCCSCRDIIDLDLTAYLFIPKLHTKLTLINISCFPPTKQEYDNSLYLTIHLSHPSKHSHPSLDTRRSVCQISPPSLLPGVAKWQVILATGIHAFT